MKMANLREKQNNSTQRLKEGRYPKPFIPFLVNEIINRFLLPHASGTNKNFNLISSTANKPFVVVSSPIIKLGPITHLIFHINF